MSETADLSLDSESLWNLPRYPTSSQATSSASHYSITASSPSNVIEILDSDYDEDGMHQNSVVNHIVKVEQKLEEIPRAIKHEILFFFLSHTLVLWSNYHRFMLNLTRDSIYVWFLSWYQEIFERKIQDTHRSFVKAFWSNQTHLKTHCQLHINHHLTPINMDSFPG